MKKVGSPDQNFILRLVPKFKIGRDPDALKYSASQNDIRTRSGVKRYANQEVSLTGGLGVDYVASMVTAEESRQFLQRKAEARRTKNLVAWEKATAECATIVDHIIEHYQPTRIWQWGSLLQSGQFDEHSDIDLALEGVTDAESYFSLLGDAMKRTSFPLDIIQLEKIEPEFREIIEAKGRIIYERSGN